MLNQINNIKIIGTSHIAKQSVEEVRKAIEEFQPTIVAVELDSKRYISLMNDKQKKKSRFSLGMIPKIGLKGYLFGLIGSYASKKLGSVVGATPGDEMLTAIKEAKKRNLEVALIDQDIEITLSRFSKALSWKEKWVFLKDIFNSIFRKKKALAEYKELGLDLETLDLTQVPSNQFIAVLTTAMKKKYPNIYRVLVSERNTVMVKTLVKMRKKYPEKKILAVVGAGHVEGMEKLFSEFVVSSHNCCGN
ncbi:TraB/GumN family protein [Candidatus Woesearchaeota archaeon]|nr:TraB/GumN family protein [Candidatus Woesearchaeota archaeon]